MNHRQQPAQYAKFSSTSQSTAVRRSNRIVDEQQEQDVDEDDGPKRRLSAYDQFQKMKAQQYQQEQQQQQQRQQQGQAQHAVNKTQQLSTSSVNKVTKSVASTTSSSNGAERSTTSSNPFALKPLKEPLDPVIMQKASRYAIRVFEEMSKRSNLLRFQTDTEVATFDRDEIIPYLGDMLGKGGFNNVYELEKIELIPRSNDESTPHDDVLRKNIITNKPRLAVKFLSDEALYNPEDNCNGSADLLMEAKYLTALASYPHPALIKLHGISREGPAGFSYPDRAGFFLVIDRLYDTLDRRINVWYELKRRKLDKKSISGMTPPSAQEIDEIPLYLKALFIQRLVCGYEIISAIAHLHQLSIIFRDLKPDNVGFDYYGRVKIFDFGLAKELDPKQQVKENSGLYYMSGGTGSRRYMAPEVSLSEPYGLSADLYSFSILLWELLTLEKAFGRLSVDEHKERVIQGTERPSLSNQVDNWDHDLVFVMEGCWRRDPLTRPTSRDIHEEMKSIIQNLVQKEFPYKDHVPQALKHGSRSTGSRGSSNGSYSNRRQMSSN